MKLENPTTSQDLVPSGSPLTMEIAGQAANGYAARGAFNDYHSRKADNTLRRHRADLDLFATFLASAGIPDTPTGEALYSDAASWHGVTWGLVEAFRNWMLLQAYAVASVNARLSTVKLYAKLATKAGSLDSSELAMIRMVTGYRAEEAVRIDARRDQTRRIDAKKAAAVTITPQQAKKLKKQPNTPQGRRDAVLMTLLLDHGLRVGEVAALQVGDVNVEAGTLVFYRPKVNLTQTHRLTKDAKHAMKAYIEAGDAPAVGPLLRASASGSRLTHAGVNVRNLSERVRTLGALIGIEGLSAHDCRHFWATAAARQGTPIDRLKDAGGWKSVTMPMHYIERAKIANDGVILDPD